MNVHVPTKRDLFGLPSVQCPCQEPKRDKYEISDLGVSKGYVIFVLLKIDLPYVPTLVVYSQFKN
jgi:hypothetical protein